SIAVSLGAGTARRRVQAPRDGILVVSTLWCVPERRGLDLERGGPMPGLPSLFRSPHSFARRDRARSPGRPPRIQIDIARKRCVSEYLLHLRGWCLPDGRDPVGQPRDPILAIGIWRRRRNSFLEGGLSQSSILRQSL